MSDTKKEKKIFKLVVKFNSVISKIIKLIEATEPNNIEIDRLKRLARIAKNEEPLFIINRCKDKIWNSREHIIEKNEKFFMDDDQFNQYIKHDRKEPFIRALMKIVQDGFTKLNENEKNHIWKIIKDLLKYVTEYKILIDDCV
jgi:hypothetical protein